jgi:uncharacterized protein (TIGR03435 family)
MSAYWILLEVTVVLALALAGTRLARKSRAAVRHIVLAAAFGVVLMLPLASLVAPSVRVEVPAAVHAVIAPLDLEPTAAEPDRPLDLDVPAAARTSARSPRIWPSLSTVFLAAWIAGAGVCLVPVIVGLWQVRSLRRSGVPWRDGGVEVGALAGPGRLRQRIDVLRHESVPGPMTCGLLRPAIVLPMDAASWTREDLHRALVHELEHVRRADWLTHCVARVVAACYWFHPVVWVAWRRLVLEAERACDDAVLRESDATAYADQLVVLAERLSTASSQPQLAMANRRDLTTRVRAVLDGAQRRGQAGAICVGAAIAACALLVMTMSPLRIVAAASQVATTGPEKSEKFDVVSIKPCPSVETAQTGRGAGPNLAQTSPGHVYWACVTLSALIDQAYAGWDFPLLNNRSDPLTLSQMPSGSRGLGEPDDGPKRVRGGPSWVYTDRFAIEATASTAVISPERGNLLRLPAPMNRALRAMLEDRFRVRLRRETEQLPLYALTVAPGGLRIKPPAPGDCIVRTREMPMMNPSLGKPYCGDIRHTAPLPRVERLAAGEDREAVMASPGPDRRLEAAGATLKTVAERLSALMDHAVLDQTGVAGEFAFAIEYRKDDHVTGRWFGINAATVLPAERARPAATSRDQTIFQALEAIGLRLERITGPVEYLVIERAEKPSPDAPDADALPVRAVGPRRPPR